MLSKRSIRLNHPAGNEDLVIYLYGYHHETYWDKLELGHPDENHCSFRFVHKNKINEKCSFQLVGVAVNIDPNGLSDLGIYDPEGEDNPTEVYRFENETFRFMITIPQVVSPFVGIQLLFLNENPCKVTHHNSKLEQYE